MRAFVITGPRQAGSPTSPARPPHLARAVVDVERAGVCGADAEFFTGQMAYLHQGHAAYPVRPGHEWSGTVSAVGDGTDPAWLARPAPDRPEDPHRPAPVSLEEAPCP